MREPSSDTVHDARTAGSAVSGGSHLRGLVVATLAALLMAFVGAFGTDEASLPVRLGYWLIVLGSGALIGIGASTGVRSWGWLAARPLIEGALISLLISLPLTLVTSAATTVASGAQVLGLLGMSTMFVGVSVITAAITAIIYLTGRSAADATTILDRSLAENLRGDFGHTIAAVARTPEAPLTPTLSERLPPHLRGTTILAPQAEDHYVRVHTEAGPDLLLMRLGDAVAELDGLAGEWTHRSWWVSRQAVTSIARSDG